MGDVIVRHIRSILSLFVQFQFELRIAQPAAEPPYRLSYTGSLTDTMAVNFAVMCRQCDITFKLIGLCIIAYAPSNNA